MKREFQVRILTPERIHFDKPLRSLRVPTETGWVGLRPGGEACVLGIEPGLIVFGPGEETSYAVTAGGLLESFPEKCTILTSFCVWGQSAEVLRQRLDEAMAEPSSELAARRRLDELTERIVKELVRGGGERAPGGNPHV